MAALRLCHRLLSISTVKLRAKYKNLRKMDFTRKARSRPQRKPEYESLEQRFPHNIMLYKYPPRDDIKIQEFEELALERLRLLRVFEQASSKALRGDDYKEFINSELTREGLKDYHRLCTSRGTSGTISEAKHEAELRARRRDYISHFILRLVYCRSEELRRWFISREMELFKYKFAALNALEIKHFLELNKLHYSPLTETEKDAVKDGLYESTMSQNVAKIDLLDFYKVPFTQVFDLIRSRRCFIKNGYAYVSSNDFVSIMAVVHLNEIEHGLDLAQRYLGEIESDERIFHLLKTLHTSYTGKDYTVNASEGIPIESLDQLSQKSFPLCMRVCHEHIRSNHHIKHFGRMQYGLFLKGIGVSLEDALRFWRDEFTKKIDQEVFRKKYEYNIYHNYGKKGSMVNYTPYSCMRIITDSGTDSTSGCPYKTYDTATLRNKLTANGLSAAHVQEVMSFVEKRHYQLACSKYFQITHATPIELAINHPNQYFEESQALMGNRSTKAQTKARMVKRATNNFSAETIMNATDDDDALWNVAESEETAYKSQLSEKTAFDDDLDLTEIAC